MKSKVIRFNVDFPSRTGVQVRKGYVYLPKGYSNEEKYPVLYMFDGHNVFFDEDATFGKSWGMKEYLDCTSTKIIVVGIECYNEDYGRMIEYSPYPIALMKTKKGYGDETMKWFVKTLKPFIDSTYSTLPNRSNTFIMGSSMGGLMSTYALIKYNKYFSRAAALSPAYSIVEKYLMEDLKNCKVAAGTTLYMDYGTKDLEGIKEHKTIDKVYKVLSEKGVNITYRCVYNGKHNEATWEKQLPIVFGTLLYEK